MWKRAISLVRSPIAFALVFQGISGLVQVSAFYSLAGQAYLDFTAAFLLGNVLSMAFVLNFENVLLAGVVTRSMRRYFTLVWTVGLVAAITTIGLHEAVPSFVAFCCLGVCLRLFLAWATHARPSPKGLALAVVLTLSACGFGGPTHMVLAAMLAFPLATWGAERPGVTDDKGILAISLDSLSEFARYLPHTISGLVVGYVDRYAALQIVGGSGAESYLRTVQMCSWAAFIIYPVVFQARRQVLRIGRIGAAITIQVIGAVAVALALVAAAIYLLSHWVDHAPVLVPGVVILAFLAIMSGQCYQVFSSLNFVGMRFGTINRITLTSAAVAMVLTCFLVPTLRTPESLATVLFSGWFCQVCITVVVLFRQQGRAQ